MLSRSCRVISVNRQQSRTSQRCLASVATVIPEMRIGAGAVRMLAILSRHSQHIVRTHSLMPPAALVYLLGIPDSEVLLSPQTNAQPTALSLAAKRTTDVFLSNGSKH